MGKITFIRHRFAMFGIAEVWLFLFDHWINIAVSCGLLANERLFREHDAYNQQFKASTVVSMRTDRVANSGSNKIITYFIFFFLHLVIN